MATLKNVPPESHLGRRPPAPIIVLHTRPCPPRQTWICRLRHAEKILLRECNLRLQRAETEDQRVISLTEDRLPPDLLGVKWTDHFRPPPPEPILLLHLQPYPAYAPLIRRLRYACKILLEQCGLRVLSAETEDKRAIPLADGGLPSFTF